MRLEACGSCERPVDARKEERFSFIWWSQAWFTLRSLCSRQCIVNVHYPKIAIIHLSISNPNAMRVPQLCPVPSCSSCLFRAEYRSESGSGKQPISSAKGLSMQKEERLSSGLVLASPRGLLDFNTTLRLRALLKDPLYPSLPGAP